MLWRSFLYCVATRPDTYSKAPSKRVAVGGFAQPKGKKVLVTVLYSLSRHTHSLIAFYILSLFID